MASSRLIVAGESYTADDINNLRADVLDNSSGHDHDGPDGKKIAFSDLDVTTGTAGSLAPSGGNHSYDEIDDHLSASSYIHGLGYNVNVLGSAVSGLCVESGSEVLDDSNPATAPITFSPEYGEAPIVVVSFASEAPGSHDIPVRVVNIPTTGATINSHHNAAGHTVNWIAIGVLDTIGP